MPASKAVTDRVFHALGDPTRRAIVERLGHQPLTVSNLATPLNITVTAVVQHLRVLEKCGLVRTEKIGRVRTCRILAEGFAIVEQWLKQQRSMWEQRLDRLGELLLEEEKASSSRFVSAEQRHQRVAR